MRLGTTVPNFKASTTKGPIGFYDWQRTSWVVLMSFPHNFTPVCLTEMSVLALNDLEFQKRDTKCLAYSTNQANTLNNWIEDVKFYSSEMTSEFPYPIISDPAAELAIRFDMLSEDQKYSAEVKLKTRATYVIDPSHKLRLATHYPSDCGRSVIEILRTIDSMQLTQRVSIVATPVNWMPGTKVMVLDPANNKDARKVFPRGFRTIHMPSGRKYITSSGDHPQ